MLNGKTLRIMNNSDYDFNLHCQITDYLNESEELTKEQETELLREQFEGEFQYDLARLMDIDGAQFEWLWSDLNNEKYVSVILLIKGFNYKDVLALVYLNADFTGEEKDFDTFSMAEEIDGCMVKTTCNMISFRLPLPEELQNQ